MAKNERSILMANLSRFFLMMICLSGVFWATSCNYRGLFGRDFPNCVAGRWGNGMISIGTVSNNRVSSLFVTWDEFHTTWDNDIESGRDGWYWLEREDVHFCGFFVPYNLFSNHPVFFLAKTNWQTLGWDCPYALMGTLWFIAFLKTRSHFSIRVRDGIYAMTVMGLVITAIKVKAALLFTLFLNVATVMLVLVLLTKLALYCCGYKSSNPWWPFVLDAQASASSSG